MPFQSRSERIANGLIHVFFTIVILLFAVPLLYILSVSLSKQSDIIEYGYRLIPHGWSLEAYKQLFRGFSVIADAYLVTIFVTVVGTIISLLLTTMLAYAMSRNDFALGVYMTRFVLFTLLFSGGLVTWYMLIVNYLHLKNTIWALILPYLVSAWHVFLMRGFLREIPQALFESAKIDGANELRIFMSLVIPLSKPALATIGLFTAFIYWNDWWLGMLFIEKQSLVPIQLMLYRTMQNVLFLAQNSKVSFDTSTLPTDSIRMAICILAAGPMMVVFPFFQKHFVKGLTVGSVKG